MNSLRLLSAPKWRLPFILIIAAGFRLYGLSWGLPLDLHIDERNVLAVAAQLFNNIRLHNSWNPNFSAYGALLFYPLSLLKILFASPQAFLYASRFLAASIGVFTVYLVYLFGLKYKNQTLGLLTAAFTAITVILWRENHFYTAETPLLLFILFALISGQAILATHKKKDYFWFGIFWGLALSVKLVAGLLFIPLLAAHLGREGNLRERFSKLGQPIFWGTVILAGIVFLLLNPYCLLDPTHYWQQKAAADLLWNALMVKGAVLPPWTVQFLARHKGLYELTALYPWAMGLPLFLAALGGLACALFKREPKQIYLLSWLLPYLVLTIGWQVKFIRYTIPVIPFLNLLAADWLLRLRSPWKNILLGLVVLLTFFYAAAYLNVYRQPDSRLTASQFLAKVAPGKVVATEVDEGFLLTEFYPPDQTPFTIINLDLFYENQQAAARQLLISYALKEADFFALSTNNDSRFSRLPQNFPLLARFYQDLFQERLGFKIIARFQAQPSFLGLTINDIPAELTLRLFDHPEIIIFAREEKKEE